MLSLSSYKVIDTVFSRVSVPAIVILSVVVLISLLIYMRGLYPPIKIFLCYLYPCRLL